MKIALVFASALLLSYFASAQTPASILGKWESAHGSGQIEIVKRGDHYFGKLINMKNPVDESGKPLLDKNNPSKELQSRPVLGIDLLTGFVYKGNNSWTSGKIYDPRSGNTYSGQLTMPADDKLNIRAYFGISLLGHTETWNRVKD